MSLILLGDAILLARNLGVSFVSISFTLYNKLVTAMHLYGLQDITSVYLFQPVISHLVLALMISHLDY